MGYTYHLKGELMLAIQFYHKAHFLKSDDSLIEELISKAMDDISNTELNPIETTFLKV